MEANACAGQYIDHRRKPRDAETEAVGFESASKVESTTMTFTHLSLISQPDEIIRLILEAAGQPA